MRQLSRKPDPHKEAKRIMRLLARRKADWPAEPSLSQLSVQQIEDLQAYIAQREKEQSTIRRQVVLGSIPLALLCFGNPSLLVLSAGLLVLFFCCGMIASTVRDFRYAVYALTQTDDLRVLPTLIQATRYGATQQGWGQHPQIRAAILRLLDGVTEAHVGLLDDALQQRLWTIGIERQTLSTNFDRETVLLTLHALANIGNQAILTRMKRFAYRSEWLSSDPFVVTTARELIPVMETRLQRQQAPETLLRAADTSTAPDTLLRPTFAATSEPKEQLLRASHSDAEETQV